MQPAEGVRQTTRPGRTRSMTLQPSARDRAHLSGPTALVPQSPNRRCQVAWGIRTLLVGVGAVQLIQGDLSGAVVAGVGTLVTLLPLALRRLRVWSVPPLVELLFVLGIFLQAASQAFQLFARLPYWEK